MLYHHIKVSIRNILRHKLFSFINIFGLALSISLCLAAMILINNQLGFDKFHPHPDRTYRVITEATYDNNSILNGANTPLPLGESLQEYDFIETTTRLYLTIHSQATSGGKELDISGSFTDPSFFEIFGFELESGNPENALSDPFSVVLDHETAQRFFGDRNPMGEVFTIEGMGDFTVTGVLASSEGKTHLWLGVLASMSTVRLLNQESSELDDQTWDRHTYVYTYALLKKGAREEALEQALSSLSDQTTEYLDPENHIESISYSAQALDDITPGKELRFDIAAGKTRSALELAVWAGVVLAILLMACFNYTNLSIARALKRAREVGIHKLHGAGRSRIILQFIVQATLMSLVAMILAYAILPFIPLPVGIMNEVRSFTPDVTLILWFLLFTIFTGLLAGGLPAWLISSVQPVNMFKNFKNLELIKGLTLRKILVVFQFTLSLVLIISTIVVYRQSQFVATADYGFQRENIINLQLQDVDHQLLRDELSRIAGIEQISASSSRFGFFAIRNVGLRRKETASPVDAHYYSGDQNLIQTMELELLAGRNFSESITSDQILVNEVSLSPLGWKQPSEAVGQSIWIDSLQVEIVGVLKNFRAQSMSLPIPIRPMVLHPNPDEFNYLNLKLASSANEGITDQLEAVWQEVAPEVPPQYSYYDQALYEARAHEKDVASIGFYALIAITIASLGLLGMVTYTVEVRTREVGIRKVLGAGVTQIIYLLSKEFLALLTIAGLIGLPIGYWIGRQFLSNYAYSISFGAGILTAGLGIMLLIGLLAIGTQTWKTANQNPVESIRSE